MTTPPPIQPPPRIPLPMSPGTRCISCSYDLGGMLSSALCPECATPAEHSLHPDSLRHASIQHLRNLRAGIQLILASIFAKLIILVLAHTISMIVMIAGPQQQFIPHGQAGPFSPQTTPQTVPQTTPIAPPTAPLPQYTPGSNHIFMAIEYAKTILIMLAMLYGWWRFTTPNPASHNTPFDPQSRRVSRVIVPIYIAIVILETSAALLPPAYMPQLFAPTALLTLGVGYIATKAISIAALVLLQIFTMLYIKALAIQLHDRGLATFASTLAWLLPILSTIGMCLLFIGPLIAWILNVVFLFIFRARLSRTIRDRSFEDARDNARQPQPV